MTKKKKKDRQPPPVITGYDVRGRIREKSEEQPVSAPDGISGTWT